MRILMLAQFYPPIIGGEERHVRNLSIELVARGHTVTVVTLGQKNMPLLEENDQGVRVYRVHASMQRMSALFSEQGRQHSPPFPDPEVLLSLRSIIQREKPDIIHAHNWIVHSFTPLKSWCKAKLVMTLHDYSLVCATKRLMYQNSVCSGPKISKCLKCSKAHYGAAKGVPIVVAGRATEKIECKAVDMFLPVSLAVATGTQLANRGVPYKVIPNFIPDNLATLGDPEHPLLTQLPREHFLLFVGDLSRDKGVEVLLQAYERMKCSMPLVLIGRPVDDFIAHVPPHVHVLQNWPHEAVIGAWQRCTIALVPSIWHDPCPTVAMEAMSVGKSVIASSIGGLVDIVSHDETGLLIPPGDPLALQEAIQYLQENEEIRKYMGNAAKKRIKEFQAKEVVSSIEQVYRELLQ